MVYQSSLEGMMVLDVSGNIVSINPTFTAITGYWPEEVLGKSPPILQSGLHDAEFYEEIWAELRNLGHWSGEIIDRRKNGKVYTARLSIDMVDDGKGQVLSWVGQFSDISEKKEAEQLIWYQANFDSLTGLPNRRMFQNKLDEEIRKSKRTGRAIALMFIDLDNFKHVNDSLGHDMGDLLLQQVADRLRECVRETDTIARLGGDEFTIILTNVDEASHIAAITQKLLANISRPIKLGTQQINASASIGITLYPWDASNAEGLLKNADQAMYHSKKDGRNCFHFFAAPSH
jgi:diguanylate cyclase (GGDEF)-like protein/PAS domain S-box-containing protein